MKSSLLLLVFGWLACGAYLGKCPVYNSNKESSLVGEWVVTTPVTTPLLVRPFCKSVQKGTIFTFSEEKLAIYTDASTKPCDTFHYKLASASHSLSVIKGDMIWLCTYDLQSTSLKINSKNFFTSPEPNGYPTPDIELQLSKRSN